jgi:hypothetical protein
MLNIRINLTINLKKVWATSVAGFLILAHIVSPAYALTATPANMYEKQVSISLTYMTVTTTKSQAVKDLASSGSKYFDPQALAFLTTYVQGWSRSEWKCLNNLWQGESHFNPKALNMSSGAYGIAQFLPTTWSNYKVQKTALAKLQIKYGLRYIMKRYGSAKDPLGACNAWTFKQKHNWY